ncbi:translation initiation factor IF-2-like [Tyto alba]|uniref:translation initiation factor IF-2-like n=1 Tax=Tyto alba TaxID=56313 RepID=UPI001C66588D|nr:translation initiation factor IF-2-like [Tyto alba]XP_042643415.1 translation initiation factor IF-2-like [Tyto alba]XP_042643416.1 translation initiation factor IF-2-like [Tyto alba]XP_042643417.1 translation initiation factor IF-2-like [Tyto alba]XP_042643418.1 translation initiation factor IF-2-like [Tyto alba]XP_042643419.1 translation initiation factor IF-2-like [Tyto alba]XP_042643420.1 translation initiation factor IF-2-like [Tyto alba]XP_042643421.1 translation initiation factor I
MLPSEKVQNVCLHMDTLVCVVFFFFFPLYKIYRLFFPFMCPGAQDTHCSITYLQAGKPIHNTHGSGIVATCKERYQCPWHERGKIRERHLEKFTDFALGVTRLLEIQDGAQAPAGRRRPSWNWAEANRGESQHLPVRPVPIPPGRPALLIASRICELWSGPAARRAGTAPKAEGGDNGAKLSPKAGPRAGPLPGAAARRLSEASVPGAAARPGRSAPRARFQCLHPSENLLPGARRGRRPRCGAAPGTGVPPPPRPPLRAGSGPAPPLPSPWQRGPARSGPLGIMGRRVCGGAIPAAMPRRRTTAPTRPRGGGEPRLFLYKSRFHWLR